MLIRKSACKIKKEALRCLTIIISITVTVPLFGREPAVPEMQGNGQIPDSASHDTLHIQYIVPSYVKVGDILFMENKNPNSPFSIPGYDHTAVYIGNNQFIEAVAYGIGSSYPGVQQVDYTYFHIWAKDFAFATVKTAINAQRAAAVNWCQQRLGDLYQQWLLGGDWVLKIADPNVSWPTADEWYCSELVWAAYYNQSIDVDKNGWLPFPYLVPAVSAQEIAEDNDVEIY